MKIQFRTFVALVVLVIGTQLQASAKTAAISPSSEVPGKTFYCAPVPPVVGERTVQHFMGFNLVKTLTNHYVDDYWEVITHNFYVEFSGTFSIDGSLNYTKTEENSDGGYDSGEYTESVSSGSYGYDIGTFDTFYGDWAWGYTYSMDISVNWVEEGW